MTRRKPRPNLTTTFVEPRTGTEQALAAIWGSQLGLESVGIHDEFFDLGGHVLLASQISSEICDRFQIELPLLKLFQASTVAELGILVDQAKTNSSTSDAGNTTAHTALTEAETVPKLEGNAPEVAAKTHFRDLYNHISRRLGESGMGVAAFFLNYGYVSLGIGDEARIEIPSRAFNRNSVRLALELMGDTALTDQRVLDVGCGRGGTVALLAEVFRARVTGVDLSPEAIAFCRSTHGNGTQFEVGDAEHLPFSDSAFDVVTNIESSHTYPNLQLFFTEVRRVLTADGLFLYTDFLPVQRWAEVRILLSSLKFSTRADRDITPNVLASCDEVAKKNATAFGDNSKMIDNFLAVPGSPVYEQMRAGAWEFRIVRAQRAR